jgi:hypothetical protein
LVAATAFAGIQTTFAGCKAATPSADDAPAAAAQQEVTIPASQATTMATGITRWLASSARDGVEVDGGNDAQLVLARVHIRQFGTQGGACGGGGYELSASDGELLRVRLDGTVLAYREGSGVLRALASDLKPLIDARRVETSYDCDIGGWLACAGTIGGAIGVCAGPEDFPCIAGIVGATGTCWDCLQDGENGNNPPPATLPQ